ncbi:hypothetical protein BaRGS_00024281 [Batillaria attramentaria]|uniref:Uncharacterized protein n=1 Tax=Batillaria attramentaria TaxID=370345 RepID=A0ABD0KBQ4_9CAEN
MHKVPSGTCSQRLSPKGQWDRQKNDHSPYFDSKIFLTIYNFSMEIKRLGRPVTVIDGQALTQAESDKSTRAYQTARRPGMHCSHGTLG